jgi:hypothetical protein
MNTDEKLWTYQELAAKCSVCVLTVKRFFQKRRKFCPTRRTVRVPDSEVRKFLEKHTGHAHPKS